LPQFHPSGISTSFFSRREAAIFMSICELLHVRDRGASADVRQSR
jgi:hypothetical protein